MVSASGVRIGWTDLPVSVRAAVEQILGAPVERARSQPGGFSPGSADRVVTATGRRAFVKAAGSSQNERTVELHRREAVIASALPASVPAPALLGVHDDGRWIALAFEDVDGRHPRTPWFTAEIDSAMAALAAVARTPAIAVPLPSAVDALAEDLQGWHRVRADPPSTLDPWTTEHLDLLCDLADSGRAALSGDQLLHIDIRADNLLVRPDGTVTVVDWPWACRGPAWLDRLLLLLNVNLFGGHDMEALLERHVEAESDQLTAVLAGLTGYFLDAARRPAPSGLPTVRRFQADQGRRSLDWLVTRLTRT